MQIFTKCVQYFNISETTIWYFFPFFFCCHKICSDEFKNWLEKSIENNWRKKRKKYCHLRGLCWMLKLQLTFVYSNYGLLWCKNASRLYYGNGIITSNEQICFAFVRFTFEKLKISYCWDLATDRTIPAP